MNAMTLNNSMPRMYKNFGQHAEQLMAYTLTGEIRKHDNGVRYDRESDIPEYHMSVKSARFSLMSSCCCVAQTFEGIIAEYMANTVSKCVAYVSATGKAYIMNMVEFEAFLYRFCKLTKDSQKSGGRYKVRMQEETGKVIRWLEERVG